MPRHWGCFRYWGCVIKLIANVVISQLWKRFAFYREKKSFLAVSISLQEKACSFAGSVS